MSETEEKKNESAEMVADLPINSQQAEKIEAGGESKGSTPSFLAFPGFTGGVVVAAGDVN